MVDSEQKGAHFLPQSVEHAVDTPAWIPLLTHMLLAGQHLARLLFRPVARLYAASHTRALPAEQSPAASHVPETHTLPAPQSRLALHPARGCTGAVCTGVSVGVVVPSTGWAVHAQLCWPAAMAPFLQRMALPLPACAKHTCVLLPCGTHLNDGWQGRMEQVPDVGVPASRRMHRPAPPDLAQGHVSPAAMALAGAAARRTAMARDITATTVGTRVAAIMHQREDRREGWEQTAAVRKMRRSAHPV